MAITIPQEAFETHISQVGGDSVENKLNYLLRETEDLSLRKNGTLTIFYKDTMMVTLSFWALKENRSVEYMLDPIPASEELIQAMIDLMFNKIEKLKQIIPTLTDKPAITENQCVEICGKFICTSLKRAMSNTMREGVPHISYKFFVPERKGNKSTIIVNVLDTPINRMQLQDFYDGVDGAIHL